MPLSIVNRSERGRMRVKIPVLTRERKSKDANVIFLSICLVCFSNSRFILHLYRIVMRRPWFSISWQTVFLTSRRYVQMVDIREKQLKRQVQNQWKLSSEIKNLFKSSPNDGLLKELSPGSNATEGWPWIMKNIQKHLKISFSSLSKANDPEKRQTH